MNHQPINTPPALYQHEDEIDLKKLILDLWANKWLIAGITALCTLAALAYALTATPYYKSVATIRPTDSAKFTELNATEILSLNSSLALSRLQSRLDNLSTRKAFFQNHPELFEYYTKDTSEDLAFARFLANNIKVELPDEKSDKGRGQFIRLTFQYPSSVDGDAVVNRYFEFAESLEKKAVLSEYNSIIESKKKILSGRLAVLKKQLAEQTQVQLAKLKEDNEKKIKEKLDKIKAINTELKTMRENRIATLKEAYQIASKLKLKTPKTISYFANKDLAADGGAGSFVAEINSGGLPLYLMGTELLEAEMQVLQSRKDDSFSDGRIAKLNREIDELKVDRQAEALINRLKIDEFIPEIDFINTELFRLSNLPDNFPGLAFGNKIDSAFTAPSPVKPNRKLIVVLGLILGLMLGLFVSLFRIAFQE